ncbi:hypothetical protein NX059_007073 [Plenodomus lindquistii]|nr:hypothetical protein NX059_007073 [Plenodomus lindquistii]
MKFSVELIAVLLTLSNVQAFAVPRHSLYLKSLAYRSYRTNPVRRDADFSSIQRREAQEEQRQQKENGGGGLKIGGLTLGGPGGGITGNGLQLGGKQNGEGQQQQAGHGERNATAPTKGQAAAPVENTPPAAPVPVDEGEKPAAPETPVAEPTACGLPAPPPPPAPAASEASPVPPAASEAPASAGPGTENQPGRAEGEAAKAESQTEAKKFNGVTATEESERFSEQASITLDGTGNAQNPGGNLGITKGSDGSTSVGGENGIQVAGQGWEMKVSMNQ